VSDSDVGVDRWNDVFSLYQLKSKYFRCLDTKQWADWRLLFTDDMVFYNEDSAVPTSTTPTIEGGDAFVAEVSRLLMNATTVHHGHMPEIAFSSPTEATGVWAMYDWVDNQAEHTSMQGFGHYYERYRKESGQWRIYELRLTRLRVDVTSPAAYRGPWPVWSPAVGASAAEQA
jgi:hypothetical protein